MFHYTCRWMSGKKTRHSKDIVVGDTVRSRFRAHWTGTVLRLDPETGCADVRVTHSRRGVPLRKPLHKHLHVGWLIVQGRVTQPST